MNKRVQEIFNLITTLDKKGADIEEVLENAIWEVIVLMIYCTN